MTERTMTPDEMQGFEDNVLRDQDEDDDVSGPASEPDARISDDRGKTVLLLPVITPD